MKAKGTNKDGKPGLGEYDGLESGELAWIYGRAAVRGGAAGLGHGPDRMQRLAYTGFVEATFSDSGLVIDLVKIPLSNSTDADAETFKGIVAGSTVIDGIDVAYVTRQLYAGGTSGIRALAPAQRRSGTAVPSIHGAEDGQEGLASGLFVLESGPFLRGMTQDVQPVDVPDPRNPETVYTVERNLGDKMAFDALYKQMDAKGLFDWTPDGILLSKLESPSGDPLGSAELDARQAQLFNVAVGGPAIAKTWTGNPELQCMPLDRVFVLIVATVTSQIADGKPNAVKTDDTLKAYANAVASKNTESVRTALASAASNDEAVESKGGKVDRVDMKYLSEWPAAVVESWKSKADALINRQAGVGKCSMTDFRVMKATSSFLVGNSYSKRCGLKLGNNGQTYSAEYIVGGWCIGTVIDNAASRSTVGHQIRIAPASMALNVNVNVEWWSGDKLHREYMDVGGPTVTRGAKSGSVGDELESQSWADAS